MPAFVEKVKGFYCWAKAIQTYLMKIWEMISALFITIAKIRLIKNCIKIALICSSSSLQSQNFNYLLLLLIFTMVAKPLETFHKWPKVNLFKYHWIKGLCKISFTLEASRNYESSAIKLVIPDLDNILEILFSVVICKKCYFVITFFLHVFFP